MNETELNNKEQSVGATEIKDLESIEASDVPKNVKLTEICNNLV